MNSPPCNSINQTQEIPVTSSFQFPLSNQPFHNIQFSSIPSLSSEIKKQVVSIPPMSPMVLPSPKILLQAPSPKVETPKTKERKTTSSSFPLTGSVYFLDLPKDEKTKKIEQTIIGLGGKNEPFFNINNITHLVTNRPLEGKPAKESKSKSSSNSKLNTNGLQQSRRKRVEKMIASSPQTAQEDIIQVALKAGKQVQHVHQFITFLNGLLQVRSAQNSPNVTVVSATVPATIIMNSVPTTPTTLNPNIINPQTLFPNGNPPIIPIISPTNYNPVSHPPYPFPPQQFPNRHKQPSTSNTNVQMPSFPLSNSLLQLGQIGKRSKKQKKEVEKTRASQWSNLAQQYPCVVVEDLTGVLDPWEHYFIPDKHNNPTYPKLNLESAPFVSPFLRNKEDIPSKSPPEDIILKEKFPKDDGKYSKKEGYCECCSMKYSNMEEHVQSERHQAFASNDEYYKGIDDFLTNL